MSETETGLQSLITSYGKRFDELDPTEADVQRVLSGTRVTPEGFAALLSPAAAPHLERMARLAHETTVRQFGKTMRLFTPLYLSNHCANHCRYCGFNAKNTITRSKLTVEEAVREGEAIAATGLRHVLLLTGEHERKAGVDYLEQCIKALAPLFPSVSLEVFPMSEEDYRRMVRAGADGLTLFQETYDPELYAELHPAGPKRDYAYRLDAPERAARAGMRAIGIGALLGLGPWRREAFLAGLHAHYLQNNYPGIEISLSLPRMRPHTGSFEPAHPLNDTDLVQTMLALRLFLPQAGITISTREPAELRDNLLPLGVTRMSAGVSTAVGGHAKDAAERGEGQFEISDPRSVREVCAMLRARGWQPVFKDWVPLPPNFPQHEEMRA